MGLLETIKSAASGLLQPVTELVDNLHTSDEERLVLKAQLIQAQGEVEARLYESETARLQAVNQTMQVEAKADGWLTRAWRPLFGISFAVQLWFMWFLIWKNGQAGVDWVAGLPEMYWVSNLGVLGVLAAGRTIEKSRRKSPTAGG